MKLISLQIDNFGTLKDYKYLFQDGINTIVHENGWGKSTLAAFIRVMFYGFDNEGKRSELENERKLVYACCYFGFSCGLGCVDAIEECCTLAMFFDFFAGLVFFLAHARCAKFDAHVLCKKRNGQQQK